MTQPTTIKDVIQNNLSIPTIPEVVQRVAALVEDPESGTAEIGEVISGDAPLAAKVLRIANSAFYGLSGTCVSTEQASTILGVRVLRNIVTQVAVIQQFEHLEHIKDFHIGELWRHAILTGHVCSFLAKKCRRTVHQAPEELYVCGLLHDVGKIVMLDGLGDAYVSMAREARDNGLPLFVAEKRRFGFNHTDVGAIVATRWGLPQSIALAIQFHHGPREKVATNTVVSLVANANLFVHRVVEGNPAAASRVFDGETAGFLGLAPRDINEAIDFTLQHQGAQV
jgi:putative nucleotidyltransferase with HDIG domain